MYAEDLHEDVDQLLLDGGNAAALFNLINDHVQDWPKSVLTDRAELIKLKELVLMVSGRLSQSDWEWNEFVEQALILMYIELTSVQPPVIWGSWGSYRILKDVRDLFMLLMVDYFHNGIVSDVRKAETITALETAITQGLKGGYKKYQVTLERLRTVLNTPYKSEILICG